MAIMQVTPFTIAIYKNGVLLADSYVPAISFTTNLLTPLSGGSLSIDDTANGTDYYEAFMFITSPFTQLEGEVSPTGSSFSGTQR